MAQKDFQQEFDELLDKAVKDAKGSLAAIIIFDLTQGVPLYHNKNLKDSSEDNSEDSSELYYVLFGEGVGYSGEAIEGFNVLNKTKEAFSNFGDKTKFGAEKAMTIEFTHGIMRIYFYKIDNDPVAICFVGSKNANIGNLGMRSEKNIEAIKTKLDQF